MPRASARRRARQRIVHLEPALVGKNRAQHVGGRLRLQRAVEHGCQIRGDQVQPPVAGVGGRHAGRRVRRPHRRRAGADPQQVIAQLVIARRPDDDLLVAAAKPEPPQRAQRGPFVRRQQPLPDAERGHEPHLLQPLQRRRPRIGRLSGVRERGDVARRETRVVVRRPHQPVEVVFPRGHRLSIKAEAPRDGGASFAFGLRPEAGFTCASRRRPSWARPSPAASSATAPGGGAFLPPAAA